MRPVMVTIHSHDHPVVRNSDGSFTFGVVNGHTHTIDTAVLNEKLLSTMTKGEDKTMPKTPEEIQKSLDDANTALEKANKIIALSGTEKAHFDTLDETGKDSFLAKSADDRQSEIDAVKKAATDEDPVVYTTMDGLGNQKSCRRSDYRYRQEQRQAAQAE